MDELVNGLMAKVGLDREKAEKVVAFLKEHADELPGWIGKSEVAKGLLDKLPGGLGGLGGFGKK